MSRYEVFITPQAWREVQALPGHLRQRLRREIDNLALVPRPSHSSALEFFPEVAEDVSVDYELRRLRIDRWRVVYAVTEDDKLVDVLAVRRRPPYDYGDLHELLQGLW